MNYSIDGIIFLISNIILFLYALFCKKLSIKEKLAYFIFFLILNCSYNIMIKPVHDYNLVIPRTFIYRQKFLGPFSIFDFICLFIVFINLPFIIKKIMGNKLLLINFFKDVSIYIIGTISFLIMHGYWLDSGSSFFSASKGFAYSLTIFVLTYKYMKKPINLVIPFAIILANGFISTLLIDSNLLWMRYGHTVAILDQEDSYTISLFIIILLFCLSFRYTKEKKYLNIKYFILFIIFLFQNFYCLYKTNIILIPLMFILYFVIINPKFIVIILSLFLPSITGIYFDQIYELFTSKAILTRMGQFSDLLSYIKGVGVLRYIFGIGLGTPYYSTTDTGDMGEIKLIDVGNTSALNYRIAIQTPILSTFKNAGFVGVIILISTIIINWIIIINDLKKVFDNNKNKIDTYLLNETLALGIFNCVTIIPNYTFFSGTLPFAMFNTFCLVKFVLNLNTIKEKIEYEDINC